MANKLFKPYDQNQLTLLPENLEDLIPQDHLVRTVNACIEAMDLRPIVKSYKGGGSSSYHPKMLLKVLIYAYTQRVYSSRQIAKALRENIHFMWLSAGNRPDFRTINRFRSSRLKESIEAVFVSLLQLFIEKGLVKYEHYFLDGTKIEANANKYSWVWGKSTRKQKAKLAGKYRKLLRHIEEMNAQEQAEYKDRDLEELGEDNPVSSQDIAETIQALEERLEQEPKNKELQKAKKLLTKDYYPRYQKYETQEKHLGSRNSYSKTDPEATFMRMKDDHMRNGQLKPGYNIQMGTENQFILGYSIHQQTTDTTTLIAHCEQLSGSMGSLPKYLITDAGYGSEENYEYLDKTETIAYVKYNNFHYEQKRSFKKAIYRVENLPYDKETDSYLCPGGKRLLYQYTRKQKTRTGYQTERRYYQAEHCEGCFHRAQCHKGKANRWIQVSFRLNRYKERARELLSSKEGRYLRGRRCVEVEAVFGQIKQNRGFKRFMLRGLEKVSTEFGLVCLAHNMLKYWNCTYKNNDDIHPSTT